MVWTHWSPMILSSDICRMSAMCQTHLGIGDAMVNPALSVRPSTEKKKYMRKTIWTVISTRKKTETEW